MKLLTRKVRSVFEDHFDTEPLMVCSPGRVNLIGEHTDYNEGFVLPSAVDKVIAFAMAKNNTETIRLYSIDMDSDCFDIPVSAEYQKTETDWVNYIIGVVRQLQFAGYTTGGFDCVFGGNIPIGSGLSSSAALEGGMAFGLSELFHWDLARTDMAKISQKAENDFVGVQCGIMDQFASLHGRKNHVLRLDCRSLDFEYYPFKKNDIYILLCDTKVRRALADSEYNVRRRQCESGVNALLKFDHTLKSLRDVSLDLLEKHKEELDEVVYKRCRFILDENQRVLSACEDLLNDDYLSFGDKMYRSHYGLRDDYEVSCTELDILVEATEKLDEVLGARMMGGGFGGCTINLVTRDSIKRVKEELNKAFIHQTGITPDFYVAKIAEGTHILTVDSTV